ncbi:hypothetical protein [Adhaeribacter soli]|uniref:Uncharacterized protein n=1 Tax=Adhaeribacter soli TaxID=2607655 RepID=A0A5N1J130_9BACT|nr:hypothetical protein [Adhaeribacter soli]KAA9340108.1 hypothetical protein F0P94_07095 [Adhaeribacter soli]
MNQEIIVEGKGKVKINKLLQWRTYESQMEGVPSARMNRIEIENAVAVAKRVCYLEAVYIVEPKLTPLEIAPLFSEGEEAVRLPRITCVARVEDYAIQDADYAALAIVWFQDDFAFPIEPEVLELMKLIPFRKLALKFDFF